MNLKELRIGNLIQDGISKTLLEVDYISEKSFSAKVIDRDKFPLSYGWKAQGIPITEKWLLDFGFEKMENPNHTPNWIWWINQNGWFYQSFKTRELILNKFLPYDQKKDLKYVHELQNLYFALTGEELHL